MSLVRSGLFTSECVRHLPYEDQTAWDRLSGDEMGSIIEEVSGGLMAMRDRSQRLHALGNAVVPVVAGLAFATLADALGLEVTV